MTDSLILRRGFDSKIYLGHGGSILDARDCAVWSDKGLGATRRKAKTH